MSYKVYFSFSTGLNQSITCPAGTKQRVCETIAKTEQTLGIKRTTNGSGEHVSTYWDTFDEEYRSGFPSVDDKTLCEIAERHNGFVRWFYDSLAEWRDKPARDSIETITPEDAVEFWPGLCMIEVAPERWTADYYRNRMEHLYEVMRGRDNEGVSFDAKALTPRQAAAVIGIFSFLDPGDLRLDVPDGQDLLASSYDGEYDWCYKCFKPKIWEDGAACRRRKCPLAADAIL